MSLSRKEIEVEGILSLLLFVPQKSLTVAAHAGEIRRAFSQPIAARGITSPRARISPERPRTSEYIRRPHSSCSTAQIFVSSPVANADPASVWKVCRLVPSQITEQRYAVALQVSPVARSAGRVVDLQPEEWHQADDLAHILLKWKFG